MWAIAISGIIMLIAGFLIGQIYLIILGAILTIIGLFGKKAYSETFATGRDMSVRRAREEAYRENAERNRREQERQYGLMQEEAIRRNKQINQIKEQIGVINADLKRYRNALGRAKSVQQKTAIQNAIFNLDDQRRQLETAWRDLAHH